MGQTSLQQRANFLRARSQVDDPLVEPCGLQGARRHLRYGSHRIHRTTLRTTKSAESVLSARSDIRIARVYRSADTREHQRCDKIRLVQSVDVRVRSKVAAHSGVSVSRIVLQAEGRREPAFHAQVFRRRGQEVGTAFTDRKNPLVHLGERLNAKHRGLYQELRKVWPLHAAIAGTIWPRNRFCGVTG